MMTTAKIFGAVLAALVVGVLPAWAQQEKFDLLIRGGHVIDPRNAIDAVMDVAIAGGRIAEVSAKIDASRANRVADATGLYVVPGLIDIHTHVFYGTEDTYLSNGHVAVRSQNDRKKYGEACSANHRAPLNRSGRTGAPVRPTGWRAPARHPAPLPLPP